MPLIGWTQVLLFSMVSICMIMQITFSSAPAWKQALCEITVTALSLGMFWILNSLYIAPWLSLKRAGALSSAAS
jgi:hypothetical protein